jgi:hypothetical protein
VTFTIEQPQPWFRRPVCGSDDVIRRGETNRRFRTVPIGSKAVYLALPAEDLTSPEC